MKIVFFFLFYVNSVSAYIAKIEIYKRPGTPNSPTFILMSDIHRDLDQGITTENIKFQERLFGQLNKKAQCESKRFSVFIEAPFMSFHEIFDTPDPSDTEADRRAKEKLKNRFASYVSKLGIPLTYAYELTSCEECYPHLNFVNLDKRITHPIFVARFNPELEEYFPLSWYFKPVNFSHDPFSVCNENIETLDPKTISTLSIWAEGISTFFEYVYEYAEDIPEDLHCLTLPEIRKQGSWANWLSSIEVMKACRNMPLVEVGTMMDLPAIPKILDKDAGEIRVIYAGGAHIHNYAQVLTNLGYQRAQFWGTCSMNGASGLDVLMTHIFPPPPLKLPTVNFDL